MLLRFRKYHSMWHSTTLEGNWVTGNGKASITEEDAVRILTAFCSCYPDLTAYHSSLASNADKATEDMQRLREHLTENTAPRS